MGLTVMVVLDLVRDLCILQSWMDGPTTRDIDNMDIFARDEGTLISKTCDERESSMIFLSSGFFHQLSPFRPLFHNFKYV
jgi:hypothetical protein